MGNRIDCRNIRKRDCGFFVEGRLCPDKCAGFDPVDAVAAEEPVMVSVPEPEPVKPVSTFSRKG